MAKAPAKPDEETLTSQLLDQAQHIAEVSDRWFVSAAGSLSYLGEYARQGMSVASDMVLTSLIPSKPKTARIAESSAASREKTPTTETAEDAPPDFLPASEPSVVSAVRAKVAPAGTQAKPNPPGVLPLVRALHQLTGEHTTTGGKGLKQDGRFWALIDVIENLTQPSTTRTRVKSAAAQPLRRVAGDPPADEG